MPDGGGCTPGQCDATGRRYCLFDGTWSFQDAIEYCTNCNYCADSSQNCGETGVDCGDGALCPDCTGNEFTYTIYRGWNLISSPFATVTGVTADTCKAAAGNFYYFDIQTGKWNVDTVGIQTLEKGVSYWYYTPYDCSVTITGSGTVTSNDISLTTGWNQVGSPSDGMSNTQTMANKCNNCQDNTCNIIITKWFNPVSKQYEDVNKLDRGKGYVTQCID
jgi:hypothetical protein